jgi:hypothetical protein
LTQFQVTDPGAAVEKVVSYEDRLYSDVTDAAASYGVKVCAPM